ncbi:MAG: GtrA family protein [Betaproteobacteria bacterium]|nr:GtrA family protein [Betaproteobacteria bacterium]MCL2885387.1 GtrA family protein [Betaproteobacteria bacterium]
MTLARQLFRFLIVGGIATAVQYALLIALVNVGVPPVPASSIGFVLSAALNYALNRRFTFASARSHREAAPRFAITALAGLAINGALMWLFTTLAGLHYLIAQVGATISTLAWNFAVNRWWTFSSRPSPLPAPRNGDTGQ